MFHHSHCKKKFKNYSLFPVQVYPSSAFSWALFKYQEATIRFSKNLLFSRLNPWPFFIGEALQHSDPGGGRCTCFLELYTGFGPTPASINNSSRSQWRYIANYYELITYKPFQQDRPCGQHHQMVDDLIPQHQFSSPEGGLEHFNSMILTRKYLRISYLINKLHCLTWSKDI